MNSSSNYFIYLGVVGLSILAGLFKFRLQDRAMKTLIGLLCLTLVSESTAYWAAIEYGNNMFVYHFFAPIQLIILGIYFDSIVFNNERRRIGLILGSLGVVVAIINTLFFQPLQVFNSNFLLFEGLVIMGLALYTFQFILTDERIDIYRYGHFWMVTILIFFWSITYTTWALFSVLQIKKLFVMPYVSSIIWSTNIITYTSMGFVLLYFAHPKKLLAHD